MHSLTNPALEQSTNPHASAAVIFHRDGFKASRLVMPAGTELPEHSLPDDVVIVVVRGSGVVHVQLEPRRVQPGTVIELGPNEVHSVEAVEELELVFVQAALAAHPKA